MQTFCNIINDELNHDRLRPYRGNLVTISDFCSRVHIECGVPARTRRSAFECVVHAMEHLCISKEACECVFPLVKQLLPLLYNDPNKSENGLMRMHCRINKIFATTPLAENSRLVFRATLEQLATEKKVAAERRTLRLTTKLRLSINNIRRNIRAGLESENIGDQLLGLITCSGARLVEILEVGHFSHDGVGMIRQVGVAKKADPCFEIIKPLLYCSFDVFSVCLEKVRAIVPQNLTRVQLGDLFNKTVRQPVRSLYGQEVEWDRVGSHLGRSIYAALAYKTRCDDSIDQSVFYQQILGHQSPMTNYNLIIIEGEIEELQRAVAVLQELVQTLLDAKENVLEL